MKDRKTHCNTMRWLSSVSIGDHVRSGSTLCVPFIIFMADACARMESWFCVKDYRFLDVGKHCVIRWDCRELWGRSWSSAETAVLTVTTLVLKF